MYNILAIMPYTQPWSDRVWEALARIMQADTSKAMKLYRVDMTNISADLLEEHIHENISRAHVIIADLTNVNPNVHIEIGVALSLRKPILFITQDLKWVTTHLHGRIIEEYDASNDDSLQRLTMTMLFRIKDKLDVIEAREATELTRLSLQDKYLVECYSHRSAVALDRYFRNATNRIDILTTNLSFLLKNIGPLSRKQQSKSRSYFDEIITSLERKGSETKVRILTLNPESDFAAKRGKQLGFAPAVFRNALRKALAETKKIAAKYASDRFEVRTYEDFPNQITFRIDDWIFNCVVAQPTQSRNHLTFKLDRRQSGVDNSFINHFQNVWGDAVGI